MIISPRIQDEKNTMKLIHFPKLAARNYLYLYAYKTNIYIYIHPEHDTKECKYIKHRWFAVNTSTRKNFYLWSFFPGKSDIFVRRIKALLYPNNECHQFYGGTSHLYPLPAIQSRWNSVGSEHDIRRTHLVESSHVQKDMLHVHRFIPQHLPGQALNKIFCKTSWGHIFLGKKNTYKKSGHTNGDTRTANCATIPTSHDINFCQETTPKSNPMAKRPFWSTGNRVDQRSDRLRLSSACGLKINQHWKA